MFFMLVLVLAVIGLFSLFSGGAGVAGAAGAAGFGALALAALAVKVAFFALLIGFFVRVFRGGPGWHPHRHAGRRWYREPEPSRSGEERFEEWHRLAHAREEVDSWVEDLPDTEPQ